MKSTLTEISELAQAVSGKVLAQPQNRFAGVGTDSRGDLTGQLFVPLKGDRFDAHDFVAQAVAQGAHAVLISEWRDEWKNLSGKASFIQVTDTLLALQAFARHWRRKHGFRVIAITGSNGKTTTKEFTHALLKGHFNVHASKGSFNNHWGVPLSILEATPEHTHLILEMGMNHSGEIWKLCQIAEPDVAVVTTVGRAHIGQLGTQADVAQAKEEIYTATPKAIHVYNSDNEWTMRMQTRSYTKQILFSSFRKDVDVHLRAQRADWNGLHIDGVIQGVAGEITVPILGRHNVVNLMAAAGLGLAVGLEPKQIWQGFSAIRDSAWGRNQIVELKNGARILFDAYNANPDSMQAMIKNIYDMEIPGAKSLIIGDMRELGTFSEQAHEEVGEKASQIPLTAVWYVGEFSEAFWRGFQKNQAPAQCFTTKTVDPATARDFFKIISKGDLIAIKGSRGMALEHVMDEWPLTEPLPKKP